MSMQCGTIFERSKLGEEIDKLRRTCEAPDLWKNPKEAEQMMKNFKSKEKLLGSLQSILRDFEDYQELIKDAKPEELGPLIEQLQKRVADQKVMLFLKGEYDSSDSVVTLYAGAGGKDAQDFTTMLLRMMMRFSEQQGWACVLVDESPGEEVGTKSATLEIKGLYSYGLLKALHGIHRLVRLSPFNAGSTRETSFAKMEIIPLIKEDLSLEIPPEDLRIDVYRSGGKGGQSVNTTDSAVRITHLPTGLVTQCQNERSQLQNKQTALQILSSKLMKLKEQQHVAKIKDLKGAPKEASWGNQIISYVLHPYHMVKDHRTSAEVSQPEKVFDGELMPFIEASLRSQVVG